MKRIIVDTDFPTDHYLSTYVSIHKHTTTADIKYVYDKRNYSKEAFCNDLENANWSSIYTQSCADDMFAKFENILNSKIQKHAPQRKVFFRATRPQGWKKLPVGPRNDKSTLF